MQPRWDNDRETIERVAHGGANTFEAIEGTNGGHAMGRITALPSACLEQPLVTKHGQEGIEQHMRSMAIHESCAKFTQHGRIKPRVGQREGKQIFPIDPTANRIGGLNIGQPFGNLEDGNHGEAGSAAGWPVWENRW